jgi:ribosome-associated protein
MPAKKAAAKKVAAKKSVASAKKAAVTQSASTRISSVKEAAVKKTAPAKGAVAKKSAAKTPATKNSAVKKSAAKKSAGRKPAAEVTEGMRLAIAAARLAEDIKAEEIVVLDVSTVSSITDFFVICSGTSSPHLKAIAREVRAGLVEDFGVRPSMADGDHESQWVVLDYGIMMVHAFHPDKRELYALEDLWGDARRVEWEA